VFSDLSPLMQWTLIGGHILLAIAGLLSFGRIWRGPTTADRVVAFDVFAALILGHCVLLGAATGHAAFFDVALAIALVTFLATVAIARYLEKGALDR